jgi:hypothetical protein
MSWTVVATGQAGISSLVSMENLLFVMLPGRRMPVCLTGLFQ